MDVVVTVPQKQWKAWLEEGNNAGEEWDGTEYAYAVPFHPSVSAGDRVYVVAFDKLRGYAPLLDCRIIGWRKSGRRGGERPVWGLIRGGRAEAVTIPQPIPGFRGYRYVWWNRDMEEPFPDWREP